MNTWFLACIRTESILQVQAAFCFFYLLLQILKKNNNNNTICWITKAEMFLTPHTVLKGKFLMIMLSTKNAKTFPVCTSNRHVHPLNTSILPKRLSSYSSIIFILSPICFSFTSIVLLMTSCSLHYHNTNKPTLASYSLLHAEVLGQCPTHKH